MEDPERVEHEWRYKDDAYWCHKCEMVLENDGSGRPGKYWKFQVWIKGKGITGLNCQEIIAWNVQEA